MPSLQGQEVLRFQQNRYPFLLIDRVTDYLPGEFARGFKNFTHNEWFFPVHFVGHPNVPGVLQIEAMAQMFTVALTTVDGLEGQTTRVLKYEANFLREVIPGDKMTIFATVESFKRGLAVGNVICEVEKDKVSECRMTITLPEELEKWSPRKSCGD